MENYIINCYYHDVYLYTIDMDDVRIGDMNVWPPMIDVVFDSGSIINTVNCTNISAVEDEILEAQEDFVISVTMITSDAMSNVMSPTQNAIFRITDNEGINCFKLL